MTAEATTYVGDMSARYLEAQLDVLDQLGFRRARALDVLDIPASRLDNPRFRLPIETAVRLYDEASRELSHEHLGLEVGFAFRVAGFAKSGRIYAFCRDLVDVIQTNARYQRLAIDAGHIAYMEEDGRTFLDFAPYYRDAEVYRHITELIFGSYGTAFRWLSWGSGKGNKAVFLRHGAPSDASLHRRVFGCPVHFDAPHNRMEYFPETVREPLPTHDPERLALTRERLDRILAESGTRPGGSESSEDVLHAALEAAIRSCMRRGHLTMSAVAEIMDRNERRLRSDLKAADIKFRDAVNLTRQTVFHERYASGDNLTRISQALAYNDQAAFTRAFKGWFGCSPTEYIARRERDDE